MKKGRFPLSVFGIIFVAVSLLAQTHSWRVDYSDATEPNQGRRIIRNPANGHLHLVFDYPYSSVWWAAYTFSTNSGISWAPLEDMLSGDLVSLSLQGNNLWVAWRGAWGEDDDLGGSIRRGTNNWNSSGSEQLWDDGFNRIYSTSTVVSPSGGSSPMAYTVYSWAERTEYPPYYTGRCYITFVAWDTLNVGRRPRAIPTSVSVVDEIDVGPGNVYNMEASIAVSGHNNADTIHIAYKWRENGVDRIFYKKNTNWINPSRIRSGVAPIWSIRTPISTPSDPITQPASQPSIEFYNNRVFVVWRGPNEYGQDIGEIYLRYRNIGVFKWFRPQNISKSPFQESRHPESSQGDWAVVFQEQISLTNWETYLYAAGAAGTIFNISKTSTPSCYPHTAADGPRSYSVWTEDLGSGNYWVYFRAYEYIPPQGPPSAGEDEISHLRIIQDRKAKYVKFFLPNVSFRIEIYNHLGNLVFWTFAREQGVWNYGKANSGVYFYLVKAEETSRSGKIVIAN